MGGVGSALCGPQDSTADPSAHTSLRRLWQTASGIQAALTFSFLAFPSSRSHTESHCFTVLRLDNLLARSSAQFSSWPPDLSSRQLSTCLCRYLPSTVVPRRMTPICSSVFWCDIPHHVPTWPQPLETPQERVWMTKPEGTALPKIFSVSFPLSVWNACTPAWCLRDLEGISVTSVPLAGGSSRNIPGDSCFPIRAALGRVSGENDSISLI